MPYTPALLQSLSQRIAAHLQHSGCADEALAALLAASATPAWQVALCRLLLSDDAFAAQVAARSYRHGNGFIKIVLLDQGFKLRLHIWLPGTPCEENIHDHRWSIASTILTGELHSEIWRDARPAERATLLTSEHRYLAAKGSQQAALQAQGTAALCLDRSTRHRAGSSYALPPETLHRICNHGRSLVATLMCSGPAIAGHTRLIPGQAELPPSLSPVRLSLFELREAINHFANLSSLLSHQPA